MSEQSDQRSGPLEGELERFTYLAPDGGYAIGIVLSLIHI